MNQDESGRNALASKNFTSWLPLQLRRAIAYLRSFVIYRGRYLVRPVRRRIRLLTSRLAIASQQYRLRLSAQPPEIGQPGLAPGLDAEGSVFWTQPESSVQEGHPITLERQLAARFSYREIPNPL
jgi:hypothetical protein